MNLYGENEVSVFGSGYTCWYYTQFYGNYLFHSVLYNPGSMSSIQDGRLGINASHGCVRLSLSNAKWIYDNIPSSTKVVVY
ncbi:L,D-transpeptidase [Mediterraneibacter catenae]|uniref:L,D-transpeptidase n=1 Tax=Mediterraneibacter catenae TaxID=2594882 RepID=UPI002FE6E9CE